MRNDTVNLKNLLQKKSIAVVGPAPTLVDKGYGNLIDSHEVVVRTNGSFLVPEDKRQDYGSRTDILYLNNLWMRKHLIYTTDKEFLITLTRMAEALVKLIVIKPGRERVNCVKKMSKFTKTHGHARIPLFTITKGPSKLVREYYLKPRSRPPTYHCEPSQIANILGDCMRAKAGRVYVTGMDFYQGAKKWVGFYGNTKHEKKLHAQFHDRDHSNETEKKALKALHQESRVFIDPFIKEILYADS
jgi:hypothetical protein